MRRRYSLSPQALSRADCPSFCQDSRQLQLASTDQGCSLLQTSTRAHGAEGDCRYSYESHNFCSTKPSYLHAYGAVMTSNCECTLGWAHLVGHTWLGNLQLGCEAIDALQRMRKQQARSARPSLPYAGQYRLTLVTSVIQAS